MHVVNTRLERTPEVIQSLPHTEHSKNRGEVMNPAMLLTDKLGFFGGRGFVYSLVYLYLLSTRYAIAGVIPVKTISPRWRLWSMIAAQ